MGGAGENDNAMRWFLERAVGGDILVIRASGSDGYNDYLFEDLGVEVNSVETIVFHNETAASDSYVLQQLQNAEAIWIAGGDQWDYVSYWRNNEVENAINNLINVKGGPVGGISAGMAIMGNAYFSAESGSAQSNTVLNDPYHSTVEIGYNDFIEAPYLESVITDTHYDDPERRGRHSVFLARMKTDLGISQTHGIACDEFTAVCIDEDGIATCYGEAPDFEDYVYFLSLDCEQDYPAPENCAPGEALTWNANGKALRVYKVFADETGTQYLDLNDWNTGMGGEWENWSIENGQLNIDNGAQPNCSVGLKELGNSFYVYPNPIIDELNIEGFSGENNILTLYSAQGRVLRTEVIRDYRYSIDLGDLPAGIYLLELGGHTQELVKY
jgi:cyanophycinase-like exopeptidase